jgi:hypothetical protein
MLLLKGYFNAIQIAGTRSLRRQYAGDHLADVIAVEAVLGQLTASILYATTYFMALHVSPTQGMRLAAFTYLAVAGIFALSRPGNLFGFQFKKKFSVVELK